MSASFDLSPAALLRQRFHQEYRDRDVKTPSFAPSSTMNLNDISRVITGAKTSQEAIELAQKEGLKGELDAEAISGGFLVVVKK